MGEKDIVTKDIIKEIGRDISQYILGIEIHSEIELVDKEWTRVEKLKSMLGYEIKSDNGKSSLLTNFLYFYLKDGFLGSVNYKIKKQKKSTDKAVRESAEFVFNILKYQLVKYLGVFNIMYKFIESRKRNVTFEEVHGIERLLSKLEYNAISEKGRLASDYGVPTKIIEYYDSEDNKHTIRDSFDKYEEEKFQKIERILNSKD